MKGSHKVIDERRLAGTDLPGNDDETLTLRQPIGQVSERLSVTSAAEEIAGVWRELERARGEAKKFLVHLFIT